MNSEPPIMATHTRHSACQHSTGAPIKATMQVNPAMSDINEDLYMMTSLRMHSPGSR